MGGERGTTWKRWAASQLLIAREDHWSISTEQGGIYSYIDGNTSVKIYNLSLNSDTQNVVISMGSGGEGRLLLFLSFSLFCCPLRAKLLKKGPFGANYWS